MTENNNEQPPQQENIPSTKERYQLQEALIEDFYGLTATDSREKRNACAAKWIDKYADNYDQLDKQLIQKYKNAQDETERKNIRSEIQESLEVLNSQNG